MTTETLSWTIDQENVIKHLIESQNGTPSTAIKELIMNLFDKGSTKADITITSEGFTDRDDIEKHFRLLWKKHEDGDAEFGRFRIGRGQIMALARTDCHSHEFRMLADYKKIAKDLI
ncbi:hypothetical protein I3271_07535 [Photobacterium leiognathi]|uniref:hypothetical protein n=1 Tax=Photobacterium leiognathi TaxID=553611 RepID=UPI001EDCB430|nr:hypothetical protein [Photobacterium leiognathi]MCG3884538.1 hypothetical protein [Photobacterium leiognathi]